MTRAFKSALFGAATLALSAGVLATTATPAAACSDSPYLGSVCWMTTKWCPVGYIAANGQLVPIAQNQALYSLFGVTFGGDGRNTFALPNLTARSVIGAGNPSGSNPPLTAMRFGALVGQEGTMLAANQIAPHTHPATFIPSGSGGGGTPANAEGTVTLPVTGSVGNLTVSGSVSNLPMSVSGPVKIATAGPVAGSSNIPVDGAVLTRNGSATAGAIFAPAGTSAPFAIGGAQTFTGTASGGSITGTATGGSVTGTATGKVSLPVTGGSTGGGGTVSVQPNNPGTQVPVPVRDPAIALTACIANQGSYPVNPN